MNKNNDAFCMMPWVHLHVGNEGWVKACCVANIPYGNINEQSLEEIWNGEAVRSLRKRFIAGEKDNRCAVCYNNEAAGCKSIRQETNEKYEHLTSRIDNTTEDGILSGTPVYWDVRFSNICNFRCRTCWHGASSRWFDDAKALGNTASDEAVITNIKDFEDFMAKMDPTLDGVEEVYFAGGEPLVTLEHYQLLEILIAKGLRATRLRYNTNFSMLKFKEHDVLKLWERFDDVELQLSIDGSGDLGELIRKEMRWNTILSNAQRIRERPNIKTKLTPTVSILNVMHLPDLYLECVKAGLIEPEDLQFNFLDRPLHYNCMALPPERKEAVIQRYSEFFNGSLLKDVKEAFEEVIQFMKAEDLSHKWPKFIQETEQLDELRDESTFELLG